MIIPKFIIDQSIINNEKVLLNNILTQQRQLKQTLALYLEKISDGIYNATDIKDSTSLVSCLNGIKKSFGNIKDNINQILELKKYLDDSSLTSYDSSYFENYNKKYMELFEKISEDNVFYYSFMESLLKYMEVRFPESSPNTSPIENTVTKEKELKLDEVKVLSTKDFEIPNQIKYEQTINSINSSLDNTAEQPIIEIPDTMSKEKSESELLHERTLYVSSSHNNAVLPYSTVELEKYFSTNPEKYNSIQDIIDKEYTVSLKKFHNPAISRFKETYNLARNKSNFSIIKSFSLACELFFSSNVDPVIIRACKNVNELYIYLSCLEDNILNEFKCFKIVYES